MKRFRLFTLVALSTLLMSTCSLLFAPMHPRDNPLDPQGVLAGPKQLIVTTTSNLTARIKLELVSSDDNNRPDGIRIVRNSVSSPSNDADGEKIRDIPLSDLIPLGGNWYSHIDDDGTDPPDEGALSSSNRYYYAIWTYNKSKTVFNGPQNDYTDINPHTVQSYPAINVEEDGFVAEDYNVEAGGVLSVLNKTVPRVRSLIRFNVSPVTTDYIDTGKDLYIKNATLIVYTDYVYPSGAGNVLVSPILRSWDFAQISGEPEPWQFIESPDFVDNAIAQAMYVDTDMVPYNWDVTEMVRNWYELEDDMAVDEGGFALWSLDPVEIDFASNEIPGNEPRLTIEYFFDPPE